MNLGKNKHVTVIILIVAIIVLIAFICMGVLFFNKKNKENVSNYGKSNKESSTALNQNSKKQLVYNDTEKFEYLEVENGIAIVQFKNKEEYDKIIIPSTIDGKKVVGIGRIGNTTPAITSVYGNCEVVIPDTVTYIAKRAFQGAKGLVKLSGGENVTEIYEFACSLCENLKEVTFIDKVKYVDDTAFSACPSLNYTLNSKIINKNQMLSLNSTVCKYSTGQKNFTIDFNQKASTFEDNSLYLSTDVDEEKDIITLLTINMQVAESVFIGDTQLAGLTIKSLEEKFGEPYAELVESKYDDEYFKCYFYKKSYAYRTNYGYILFETNLSGTDNIQIVRNGYTKVKTSLDNLINK